MVLPGSDIVEVPSSMFRTSAHSIELQSELRVDPIAMITCDTPVLPSKKTDFSTLEGEARANLVGTLRRGVVQPLGVEGETEGCADTRAKGLDVAYGYMRVRWH